MTKKAAEVKTTVGDLVKNGTLTSSDAEATHVYDVETKQIAPVGPQTRPTWLTERDVKRLSEKWAKEEIIRCLTERRDLYVAHKADFKGGAYVNTIHFYKPFLSPVQLYVRVKLNVPGAGPYDFDWAVKDLLQEGKISLVSQDTYSSDHPNDFREAQLGDLFLNVIEVSSAYGHSVGLCQAEEALTDGELTAGKIPTDG